MMHRTLLLVLVSAAALRSQAPEAGTFKFRDGGGPIVSVMLEIGGDRSTQLEELGPSSMAGVSYLRRAPRSNEIFFVYDQATVKPMIDAFLTAWRARPTKEPN